MQSYGLTEEQTALFLGISRRQLARHVQRGMPRIGQGRMIRFGPEAFKWFREYQARQNEAGERVGALTAEQARATKIAADRAAIKLTREQGELVPAGVVKAAQEQIARLIAVRLLAIPARAAASVCRARSVGAVKGILQEEVYSALSDLASRAH